MIKKLIKKLKRLNLINRYFDNLKISIKINHVWYGNKYGGFFVCPELLNKDSIIYSFGIGEDISFDKILIENHDCFVFGFDPTPKSINWIKRQEIPVKFHFFEFGISNKSGLVDFYLPKNSEYVSGSIFIRDELNYKENEIVQMKTIKDIISELGHKHIDVLKMDIEGSEYDVIEDILKSQISINQILLEFHDRFFKNGKSKTHHAIKQLKTYGYEIFAISESFEEVSFVKKSIL